MPALTPGLQPAGLPHDTNPIDQPFGWLQSTLLSYIQGFDPGGSFSRTAVSIAPALSPRQGVAGAVNNTLAVRMATQCGAGASVASCGIHAIATDLSRIAWVVLAVVLLARLTRLGARGEFRSPAHVIYDLGPRIVGGVVAMQGIGPVLIFAIKLTMAAALLLASVFLSVASIHNPGDVLRDLGGAASVALMAVPLFLTVEFLFILMEVAVIGLMLLSLVAPILIALALYGEHGRIATVWFRAVTSCLLILLVAPVGVAASIALVVLINTIGPIGITSGALAGEAGLLATSIAAFVLAKSTFHQTRDGFRVTLEGVHLEGVANLPGQAMSEVRHGLELGVGAGLGAAQLAAGDPRGAMRLGSAAMSYFRTQTSAPGDTADEVDSSEDVAAVPVADPTAGPPEGARAAGGEEEAGAVVAAGGNPMAGPDFRVYCDVRVDVENRPGPLSALADLIEGRGDRRRVSVEERKHLYAKFLADRPDEGTGAVPGAAARPAA